MCMQYIFQVSTFFGGNCHRCQLIGYIHSRALFTTTLHGKNKTNVLLPGVSSEMMSALLSYIYLRKLNVTEENVYKLLTTADYLSILGVLEICCNFLEFKMNPYNCISIMLFARTHFCRKLAECAWKYIMRYFVQVAALSIELLSLNLSDLQEIINDDALNVKSEETVWEVILKWINHDSEERKRHIVSLMKCIRLGLLDTQFFLEHVKDHPYVTSCEESRPMIIETLKFLYDLETISHRDGEVPTPEIARPRVPHEVLFAIGGWSGGSPTNYMETYDTRADRWVKVEEVDPMGPRAYHGTAVVDFNIYVIGGFDGMDYFNSCRCFDAVQKRWKEVAPMHARRCYVSTAVLSDFIYAMGGYDGHHRQNTAEKYNPKNNQWSLIAPMNMQRSDASACTLNGKFQKNATTSFLRQLMSNLICFRVLCTVQLSHCSIFSKSLRIFCRDGRFKIFNILRLLNQRNYYDYCLTGFSIPHLHNLIGKELTASF